VTAAANGPDPLSRELLVVTGKGGVGKTTVAVALGLAAVRRGLRVIVAEVAARDDVTRALGADTAAFAERELAGGVHHISIDPEQAFAEYLRDQLPGPLARPLIASRSMALLAAATPGLRELLSIGKVWELAQDARRTPGATPYDLVILDAPATGHGLALLRAPRTYADAARAGPIARQAATIDALLRDPRRTAVVAVTTAQEMPVTETFELQHALRDGLGLELDRAIVNAVSPARFSAAEVERVSRDVGGATARVVAWQQRHASTQRSQIVRLRRGLGAVAVQTLPLRATARLSMDDIAALAARL
jgi:anion-transporting  ArsA/GET3 family ATPase